MPAPAPARLLQVWGAILLSLAVAAEGQGVGYIELTKDGYRVSNPVTREEGLDVEGGELARARAGIKESLIPVGHFGIKLMCKLTKDEDIKAAMAGAAHSQ